MFFRYKRGGQYQVGKCMIRNKAVIGCIRNLSAGVGIIIPNCSVENIIIATAVIGS